MVVDFMGRLPQTGFEIWKELPGDAVMFGACPDDGI
jgi:hypothetical protein